MFQGIVKVGAVDADQHKSLGGQYNVRGFPTIKIFGANKNKPEEYQGMSSGADAFFIVSFSCFLMNTTHNALFETPKLSLRACRGPQQPGDRGRSHQFSAQSREGQAERQVGWVWLQQAGIWRSISLLCVCFFLKWL